MPLNSMSQKVKLVIMPQNREISTIRKKKGKIKHISVNLITQAKPLK